MADPIYSWFADQNWLVLNTALALYSGAVLMWPRSAVTQMSRASYATKKRKLNFPCCSIYFKRPEITFTLNILQKTSNYLYYECHSCHSMSKQTNNSGISIQLLVLLIFITHGWLKIVDFYLVLKGLYIAGHSIA